MAKDNIIVNFQYDVLAVHYTDETPQYNEAPITTDTSALMTVLDSKKVGSWDIKVIIINVTDSCLFIANTSMPDRKQLKEEYLFTDFTAGEQTTINNFINSL